MRNSSIHNAFSELTFVKLKDNEWLDRQRVAGKVAAGALSLLEGLVKKSTTLTTLEMSRLAEEYILDNKCSCTFKGYKGHGTLEFPEAVCISIKNKTYNQLVHGIPNDCILEEGDLVSFDLGTTYDYAIADTAITCLYGNEDDHKDKIKLINATKEALQKGINAAKVGNRIGDIGNAIYKSARGNGYNVVVRYGGHGISDRIGNDGIRYGVPHAQPFVPNKAEPNTGIRIQEGLTIAIEPLLTPGSTETWIGDDGWSVYTKNISNHMEHSIFVHNDMVEVMTRRYDEKT